jgi:hypothetical protein
VRTLTRLEHRNGKAMYEAPDLTLLSSLYQSNRLLVCQTSYKGLDDQRYACYFNGTPQSRLRDVPRRDGRRTIDLALMNRRDISAQSEKSKVGERHKLRKRYSYVDHLGTVSVRPNQKREHIHLLLQDYAPPQRRH